MFAARIAGAALALALAAGPASAFDDAQALAGLKEAKVVFDITAGDAKGLLGRLTVIEETRQSLVKQGVTPHFILTFRGPATKLVQTDEALIDPKDRPLAAKVAAKLQEMAREPGVESLQQCSVAVRQQKTDATKVVPGVKVVGNGFISAMAYQQKGYAYIKP